MMKRIMAAIWTITAMLLAILLLADYSNNRMIEKFNNGQFEQNPLGFLGFMEPQVNYYNRGNVFYSLGQYELAQAEYEQALDCHLYERQDCRLRVNYALSLVESIDPAYITDENLDEVLAILDQARDILCENGCASRTDNSGHYPDAQRLKNEIDAFEEWLTTPPEPSPTPEETPTPTPGGDETPTPTPEDGETPTPTPEGGDEGPTPTPEGGEGGPTPTPEGGGQGGATPTPTLTPEEQIIALQNEAQQERYAGANGTPDDPYSAFTSSQHPW